jgi:hypothetical protein
MSIGLSAALGPSGIVAARFQAHPTPARGLTPSPIFFQRTCRIRPGRGISDVDPELFRRCLRGASPKAVPG